MPHTRENLSYKGSITPIWCGVRCEVPCYIGLKGARLKTARENLTATVSEAMFGVTSSATFSVKYDAYSIEPRALKRLLSELTLKCFFTNMLEPS